MNQIRLWRSTSGDASYAHKSGEGGLDLDSDDANVISDEHETGGGGEVGTPVTLWISLVAVVVNREHKPNKSWHDQLPHEPSPTPHIKLETTWFW